MRVGIIGTGAMGGLVGGMLHRHAPAVEVVCVEVEETIIEAITSDGLRIERPDGEDLVVHPTITDDPSAVDPVDVALLFTKSFDSAGALDDAEPMIDGETRVVTLQNGISNYDLLVERFSRDRAMGGHTYLGSNTIAPGHVRFMGAKPTVVGGADRATREALAAAMTRAGLPTEAVADPLPHIWEKQLWNVARKPISALCELRNGPQHELEETRFIARRLIEEALAVARARGVEVLEDDPVGEFLASPDPAHYDKKSSILEDVEAGRRTEIGAINGAVVAYAEEAGIEVPYNRAVTALVRGKEHGYLED